MAVCGLLASATVAGASSVGSEKQKVAQLADQLDNLENRLGQLGEDYGAAQDKKAGLDQEIADSQARIAQQEARLGELAGVLGDIAVNKYVTGSALELSPLFSNAAAYTEAEQKDSLSRLALDSGSGSTDEMLALAEDLAKEQAALSRKQEQVADLVADLDAKMSEAEQLQTEYEQKLASAQAELGAAIEAERERRAEQAAADELARQKQAADAAAASSKSATATATVPRGGGTGGSGGSSGGADARSARPGTRWWRRRRWWRWRWQSCSARLVDGRNRHQCRDESTRRPLSVRCRSTRCRVRLFRSHEVRLGTGGRLPPAPVRRTVRIGPTRLAS